MGLWDIIIPQSGKDWVTNPSVETDLTGYTAVGGSIARTTTVQKRGVYSILVTPTAGLNDGVYYALNAPISSYYVMSVDIKASAGLGYKIYVYDVTAAAVIATQSFAASGNWDRPAIQILTGVNRSLRLYVTKDNHTSTIPFYIDGLMLTDGLSEVTYFDGDMDNCFWEATAHQSRSTRSEQATKGGIIVNFDDMDVTRVAIEQQQGTGIGPVSNLSVMQGSSNRTIYQGTIPQPRTFNLKLWVEGETWQQFLSTRKYVVEQFYPGRQFQLRYRGTSNPVIIDAVYEAGFELNTTEGFIEHATIRFTAYDPFWHEDGEEGILLAHNNSISNTFYVLRRLPDGTWQRVGNTLNGMVRCITKSLDGTIYIGGEFTTAGGVTVNGVAKLDEVLQTWLPLGTGTVGVAAGANFRVQSIVFKPDGNAIIAGGFASAGGLGSTSAYIVIYTPSTNTFSVLPASNPRINDDIYQVLYYPITRQIFIASVTTGIYGSLVVYSEDTDLFASVNGSFPDGDVYTLVEQNDYLYSGGEYINGDTLLLNRVSRWPISGGPLEPLDNGLGETQLTIGSAFVNRLAFDRAGMLYASGSWDDASGDTTIQNVGAWNGRGWVTMGDFSTFSGLGDIFIDNNDHPVLTTTGTHIDGFVYGSNFVKYTGSHWIGFDTELNGFSVNDMLWLPDGTMYVALSDNTALKTGILTSVTNFGTADANPTVYIKGPGTLHWISNNKTGMAVQFTDFVIFENEYIVIKLGNRENTIMSNIRGNLTSKFVPGSQSYQFVLVPGTQPIEMLLAGSTYDAAKATIAMSWVKTHWAIEGAMI